MAETLQAPPRDNMGLGILSNPDIRFKRKNRYTMRLDNVCGSGTVDENFVKLAARPSLTIDETEINFLNAKTWLPGKGTWDTISLTYFDIDTKGVNSAGGDSMNNLWNWLATTYDFSSDQGTTTRQGARAASYSATATLTLYDGCGEALEQWKLLDAWPSAINFGDLDGSSSDECNIELTIRFSRVQYLNNFQIIPCCNLTSAGRGLTTI